MAKLSKKRQVELEKDKFLVAKIYDAACVRFGKADVDKERTKVWDMRCIWGMQGVVPFTALLSKSMSEVLYVLELVLVDRTAEGKGE